MNTPNHEHQRLLEMAQDKGHTPSRAQMRQALVALDEVDREGVRLLESLILRCDSVPPLAALDLASWSHPERALRLASRYVDSKAFTLADLLPAIELSLTSPHLALFRQGLRVVGRYALADLIDLALRDPRCVQEPGLMRIALDSAAKCAGQSEVARAWVDEHGQDNAKAQIMAKRETLRAQGERAAWQIPDQAVWMAGIVLCARFKEGMHDWVIAELKASAGVTLLKIGRGMVWVQSKVDIPYAQVLAWRTVLDHAFALPVTDLETLVAAVPMQAQLQSVFGEVPITFRVGTQGQGRNQRWKDAAALVQAWPNLVNEPRQSDLELAMHEVDGVDYGCARPRLRDRDHRFDYRVAEIPAASHPTVAAGLVAAVKPKEGDRIWDPFAGSGLELIEAGLYANCELLLGTDIDAQALDCARANAQAAGLELTLQQHDATTVALPSLTKVISNPPHGRRVAQNQDLQGLYHGVLRQAMGALVPGGELHWLVVQPRWGLEWCDQWGMHSEVLGRIDLGGIVVHHQKIVKQSRSSQGRQHPRRR